MKLAICLPLVDDMVHRSFFTSFTNMIKPDSFELLVPTLSAAKFPDNHATVRNDLVSVALQKECTHIWMMDTDQVYPDNTFVKLINHNLPVVCAKVHRRYPPFDPLLYQKTRSKYKFRGTPIDQWKNGELVEVVATGAACMLVSAEVFNSIKPPWFKILKPTKKRPFIVGEDVYFWTQVREAGYRIFVDTSIEVGHMSNLTINRGFYELCLLVSKMNENFMKCD